MSGRFWRIVTPVTVWYIAASLCFYGIYAGTSLFQTAYSLSGVEIGFIISALTLGWAIFLLPAGVLTDRYGEDRMLPLGLLGLSLSVFLVAIATTYWFLLVAVFLLGAVYSTGTPGTNKAIFRHIEPGHQHSALGIKQIGPTIGSAGGALLITGLASVFFWEAGYLLAGGVGVAVAACFYRHYPETDQADAAFPDFRGLVENRTFLIMLPVGTCLGATFYTTTGYIVPYITTSIEATVATGGVVLATSQVANSTGRIAAGGLADKLPGAPRSRTAGLLAIQSLGGGVLFLLLPHVENLLLTTVLFAGLGVLILGAAGMYFSCISTLVGEERLGAASAAGQLGITVSGLFIPPIFGYLIDTSGYGSGWVFLGVISCFAGIVMLLVTFDVI